MERLVQICSMTRLSPPEQGPECFSPGPQYSHIFCVTPRQNSIGAASFAPRVKISLEHPTSRKKRTPDNARTKRRAEGARPRDLDRRIAADRGYTHAARAAPQHQQRPIGPVPVFPRTPPKEIAWFRYRLEPISLQILVQLVDTDF